MKYITTSWDDGHVLDFRLADLLNKYSIPGTFYIPKSNAEHEVMLPQQVTELAKGFEIGGHTLSHIRLHTTDTQTLEYEIAGSYKWLSDLLGDTPVSFCFPGGVFHDKAVAAVYKSGYKIARTTELLSTKMKLHNSLTPTTLQVYEHNAFTYTKHLLKRRRITNLMQWLSNTSLKKLSVLTENYLNRIDKYGGCFHLWGHSWEIEELGLWGKLEDLLRIMSNRDGFHYIANKEIINQKELI